MTKILTLFIWGLCLLNAFGQEVKVSDRSARKNSSPDISEEKRRADSASILKPETEYEIYTAVLGQDEPAFVIRNKTVDDGFSGADVFLTANGGNAFLKQVFKELADETIENFRLRNKQSAILEKKFPSENNYILIGDEELKAIFSDFRPAGEKQSDWETFYKKYPQSRRFYSFSRIGFNQDGDQALIYAEDRCGVVCGRGFYCFLRLEDGQWKVVGKVGAWIS